MLCLPVPWGFLARTVGRIPAYVHPLRLPARAAEHRYTNHYVPHAAVYRHHCASRESQFLLVSSFRQLIGGEKTEMAKTIYFTDNSSRTAKQGPGQCSTARLCPDGRRNPEMPGIRLGNSLRYPNAHCSSRDSQLYRQDFFEFRYYNRTMR